MTSRERKCEARPLTPYHDQPGDAEWRAITTACKSGGALPGPWAALFDPFRATRFVVGQFGQSLDGRIATPSGESKYINGEGGLAHLHRLRALVDAVVVGVSTAVADDPQLGVRFCEGRSPARVVIDPNGRTPRALQLFREDGARRVVVTGPDASPDLPPGVEHLVVDAGPGGLAPAAVADALAAAGLGRLLIEGGAQTVSRFLAAGALDRLHVIVAPVLIGAGPTGIALPGVERLADVLRPPAGIYRLGGDVLFDCDLTAARPAASRPEPS